MQYIIFVRYGEEGVRRRTVSITDHVYQMDIIVSILFFIVFGVV